MKPDLEKIIFNHTANADNQSAYKKSLKNYFRHEDIKTITTDIVAERLREKKILAFSAALQKHLSKLLTQKLSDLKAPLSQQLVGKVSEYLENNKPFLAGITKDFKQLDKIVLIIEKRLKI